MFRTHNCGELRSQQIDAEVTLAGWVQTVRDKGAVVYIDLRDRYGLTQIVVETGVESDALRAQAQSLGREWVVQVTGRVAARYKVNKDMETGEVEIRPSAIEVLNRSAVPPFSIEDNTDGGDDLRMRYRYLDLRRAPLRRNLELRYSVGRAARNYLHNKGFLDIETPFLVKSTPEGARDFVVPSRMNAGEWYALPQSPQTFKQLLMVSGYDRYYQIVKCFRDEDLRADRQPEFTQIDCEMAFVEQEDVLQLFEGMVKEIFREVKGIEYTEAVPRMGWEEAMWRYGNDKPDIRFGMEIANLKVPTHAFPERAPETLWNQEPSLAGSFAPLDAAETVLALTIPNGAAYTRKQLDALTDWVKRPQVGMQGLVHMRVGEDGSLKSSVDKFFSPEAIAMFQTATGAAGGDLVLILAGAEERTRKAASDLRLHLAGEIGWRKPDEYKLLWVIDFPLFEYDEVGNRWVARHHPFTAPHPDHIATMIDNDPGIPDPAQYLEHSYARIKANAYDMVLNGNEIGGGSIRIYQRSLQEKMFAALGMSVEEAEHKFGFLLGAFEYGAPPHGGIAFGFDRLCALLGGSESIRDFIAFPKNNAGRDVMLDAPATIDTDQLKELHLLGKPERTD